MPALAASLCALALGSAGMPASAQVAVPAPAPAPATSDSRAPCVDVAINDHPALSYDCLNRRLAVAAAGPAPPAIEADAVTREPGNRQVGQYNFSALSHRMGANLGHSVQPQRPPPPPSRPANPFPSLTGAH